MTAESLRIALLTYKGNPFCGGQGVYVRHLSRELVRLGHRVEVIGSQPYPVLDEGEDLAGLSLTELPSLDLYRSPDPFRTPKFAEYRDWVDALEVGTMWTGGFPEPLTFSLRARRHLRARRGEFDVVHDNQTLGYGLLGDIGGPLVTTIHHPITVDRQLELDAAENWQQRMSKRRWYAFTRMQKRVARRLPSVVTVSGTSRDEIVEHLGVRPGRISVVHIGADTDLFSPNPAVAEVPGRIVTTSSADVPLKGLVYLVEALAKVRAEQPDAHLVVVGKRPEEGPVAGAIARYGLEGAVEFVKGISDQELVDLVRSAQVACVPSSTRVSRCPPPRPWPPAPRSSPPPAARSPRWRAVTARPASPCRPPTRARSPSPSPGCSATVNCAPGSARQAVPASWNASRGRAPRRAPQSSTARRWRPLPGRRAPYATKLSPKPPGKQGHVLTVDFTRFLLRRGRPRPRSRVRGRTARVRVLPARGAGRRTRPEQGRDRRGRQVVRCDEGGGEAPAGATATAMEGDALQLLPRRVVRRRHHQ